MANVLALGAIALWMLNGNIYRPAEDFGAKELSELCTQGVEERLDDEDVQLKPMLWNRGLYFICDVVTEDPSAYRIPVQRRFPEELLEKVYQRLSLEEIRSELGVSVAVVKRNIGNAERSHNKRIGPTMAFHYFEDDGQRQRPQFRAMERGAVLTNVVQPQGRDVEELRAREPEIGFEEDEDQRRGQTLDERLADIWLQMFFDVLEVVPNRKKAIEGSYCSIPKIMRRTLGKEELFTQLELPFNAAKWACVDSTGWFQIFERFFPKKGALPPRHPQNFPACKYYIDYLNLLDETNMGSAQKIHSEPWQKFKKLKWMPYAKCNRMWCTTAPATGGWKYLPGGQEHRGPQIAINAEQWNRQPIILRTTWQEEEGNASEEEE